jgi:major membrane immunogen (membrane-anchored lipoprotein)
MTKKNLMPIIVLTSICIIVAALLGGVNELTKDKIRDNALKKEQASLIEVLPESTLFDEIDTSAYSLPETVKSAYRETSDKGYVLIMATRSQYSTEDMTISVGIYPDGSVAGVKLTNYKESKDFGKTTYPQKYVGTTADNYDDVEVTSGVTISSNAFKAAIGDAIRAAQIISENSADTVSLTLPSYLSSGADSVSPADLAALVSDGNVTETAIPEGAPDTLKALYTAEGGGYVLYIVVPGQYVPVATEAYVYVNGRGIIENIDLLTWVVGHGVEPGDFEKRFIGKSVLNLKDVELVSGATGTSLDFFNATDEALNVIADLANTRDASLLVLIAENIKGSGEIEKIDLPEDAPKELVAVYKDKNGNGSAAHFIVAGAYVPVASEAVVIYDEWGIITDVTILQWVVGHGVGYGDFEENFVGTTKYKIKKVELVSGCTGTSGDLRAAIANAYPYIPARFPIWQVVGIVVLTLSVLGYTLALVMSRKRRAAK